MTPWAPCTIVWAHSAAAAFDALDRRDSRLAERIHAALGNYALTGHGDIHALVGRAGYRLRVGDWRAIIALDLASHEVHVLVLANRRDIYRR